MKAYIIDRTALEQNLAILQKKAGDTCIWGVVKGDGYGLGCVALAQVLYRHGITNFAVTRAEEAAALRQAGFEAAEILMLEATSHKPTIETLLDNQTILTVGSLEMAQAVNTCAREKNVQAQVHIKIDTGMGRYGFLPQEMEQILTVYTQYSNLQVTGIYTHFYDSSEEAPTRKQFDAFRQVVKELESRELDTGMVHCCNSSAFWKYPDMHWDAVRIGSGLLGRMTVSEKTGLIPLGYCEATLEGVRTLPKGHPVGYGAGYITKAPTRIGVVDVGYINGFAVDTGYDLWRPKDCLRGIARYVKALINKKALYVRVNGKPCRVLGHVGMVNMVVDVSDCICKSGDPVRVDIKPLAVRNMDVIFK